MAERNPGIDYAFMNSRDPLMSEGLLLAVSDPEFQSKYTGDSDTAIQSIKDYADIKSETTKELQRTAEKNSDNFESDLWKTYEKEQSDDETFKNNVRLGTILFNIPPESIQISEHKNMMEFRPMRTNEVNVLRTGNSNLAINMRVVFSGADDINNKLRHLIAQTKCTPFLPLKNDFIIKTATERGYLPVIVDLASRYEKFIMDYSVFQSDYSKFSKRTFTAAMEPFSLFPDLLKNEMSSAEETYLLPKSVPKSVRTKVEFLHALIRAIDTFMVLNESSEDIIDHKDEFNMRGKQYTAWQMLEFQDRARKLLPSYDELVTDTPKLPKSINVIVSNISVSTSHLSPNLLEADIRLFYFNNVPFGDMEYRGVDGRPVTSIVKCAPFIKWYAERFLVSEDRTQIPGAKDYNLPTQRLNQRLRKMMNGIEQKNVHQTVRNMGQPKLSRVSEESLEGGLKLYYPRMLNANQRGVEKISALFKFDMDNQAVDVGNGNTKGAIIDSISVSTENIVGHQPTVSGTFATAHYMGNQNAKIFVNITLDEDQDGGSEVLAHLHQMNRAMDQINLNAGFYGKRFSRLFIENPIINMIGIESVQLEEIQFSTGDQPGVRHVSMILSESIIEDDRKNFKLSKSRTPKDPLNLFETLKDLYQRAFDTEIEKSLLSPEDRKRINNPYFDLLFGSSTKNFGNGIITPNLAKEVASKRLGLTDDFRLPTTVEVDKIIRTDVANTIDINGRELVATRIIGNKSEAISPDRVYRIMGAKTADERKKVYDRVIKRINAIRNSKTISRINTFENSGALKKAIISRSGTDQRRPGDAIVTRIAASYYAKEYERLQKKDFFDKWKRSITDINKSSLFKGLSIFGQSTFGLPVPAVEGKSNFDFKVTPNQELLSKSANRRGKTQFNQALGRFVKEAKKEETLYEDAINVEGAIAMTDRDFFDIVNTILTDELGNYTDNKQRLYAAFMDFQFADKVFRDKISDRLRKESVSLYPDMDLPHIVEAFPHLQSVNDISNRIDYIGGKAAKDLRLLRFITQERDLHQQKVFGQRPSDSFFQISKLNNFVQPDFYFFSDAYDEYKVYSDMLTETQRVSREEIGRYNKVSSGSHIQRKTKKYKQDLQLQKKAIQDTIDGGLDTDISSSRGE